VFSKFNLSCVISAPKQTLGQKKHLNIPKTNSMGKLCLLVCNCMIVFCCRSYKLFSKNDYFYQNFQDTEAIEQTAKELSFASFPCGHCEYAATDGANPKNTLKQNT
jgi:hypothetical protein